MNRVIKTCLIHRRKSDSDGVDAPDDEMVDGGMEWPPNENRDVARYRNFYQVIHAIQNARFKGSWYFLNLNSKVKEDTLLSHTHSYYRNGS